MVWKLFCSTQMRNSTLQALKALGIYLELVYVAVQQTDKWLLAMEKMATKRLSTAVYDLFLFVGQQFGRLSCALIFVFYFIRTGLHCFANICDDWSERLLNFLHTHTHACKTCFIGAGQEMNTWLKAFVSVVVALSRSTNDWLINCSRKTVTNTCVYLQMQSSDFWMQDRSLK